jgi:CubicO group peptidase (beta-lactamase class C family)
LPDLADRLFASWNKDTTPGCSVAVAQAGQPVFQRAYGLANLETRTPNTPETVFESGSIAKQFTAAAIVLLARDGKLALSDDIRKHLPEMPDYGARITVDHLLTHTSGLRDWGSIVELEGWPRGTRAVTMEQALSVVARQRALNFRPGERYSYTNTGYVLAALIVQRVSGLSLAEFTRQRLFTPLGMHQTQWRDNFRRVVANRAVAYSRADAGYEQDMPFEDVYGHGGMLTTAADLLAWNDALTRNLAAPALAGELAQKPPLPAGQASHYGRGLALLDYRGTAELSHDGATAGYRTWLARFPEHGLSIAALCNTADAHAARLGRALAQGILALPAAAQGATADQPAAGASSPAAYAGSYYNELNGNQVQVAWRDGGLVLSNGTSLRPQGGQQFAVGTGTFTFNGADTFVAQSASTEPVRYRKMGKSPLPPAALKAYTGTYRSDEAQAAYQVASDQGQLVLRHASRPEYVFRLAPLATDTFGAGNIVVRFQRDGKQRITGASVSTDRLFGMAFTRMH